MRIDVIILSDIEAEVHYKPGCLARLFGSRHMFTPIVRVHSHEGGPPFDAKGASVRWLHKHTGRPVSDGILDLLERLPSSSGSLQQQLLLDAANEVEAIGATQQAS